MTASHVRHMDWNLLRLFYFMCQSPTLTEAAKHLHVTQSCLSRRLATLESNLGYRLFHRGHRGLTLVQEGQDLLALVSPVFDKFTRFQTARTQQSQTAQGVLKVLVAPSLPVSWLTRHTSKFLDHHPNLSFHLIQQHSSSSHLIKQADCAIGVFDPGREDDLIQQPLCKMSYGLYTSRGYLNKKGAFKNIADVQHHPKLILKTPESDAPLGWPKEMACDAKSARLHEFSTAQDLFDATRQGLGVAALPRGQADAAPDLAALPFYLKDQEIELYYTYPKFYQDLKRVTLYGDFLQQHLKDQTESVVSVHEIALAS